MEAEEALGPSPDSVAVRHGGAAAAVVGPGDEDLAAFQLDYRVVRGVPF